VYQTFTDPTLDNSGQYPVAVLNLYTAGHSGDPDYRIQDQVVCVPEPFTMIFLGACLVGAGIASWKFKGLAV
jgi:hypothetical protein